MAASTRRDDPGGSRRPARAGAPRWQQDARTHVLRHRDEHRQHLAAVRTRRDAGDDSPEGRWLDGVRQHLHRHIRQRLHGLCVRLQQPGRRRDQLHGERRARRAHHRSLSGDLSGAADGAAAVVSPAAVDVRRRSSRQQDSRTTFHLRSDTRNGAPRRRRVRVSSQ